MASFKGLLKTKEQLMKDFDFIENNKGELKSIKRQWTITSYEIKHILGKEVEIGAYLHPFFIPDGNEQDLYNIKVNFLGNRLMHSEWFVWLVGLNGKIIYNDKDMFKENEFEI